MSSGIYKRIKPAWNKGTTKYEQITCSVCGKLFQAEKWRNRKVCSFRCKIKRFTSSGILSRIGKKPWNYNGKLMLEKQLRNHPITEKVRIVNITKAVIRDALTNKIKRVYITQNTIQLAGRNVVARRLANETTYTGILNYGALLVAGPTETFRKLTASATYDDAVAKAYVTWFFTAAEVSGTFVQWRNYIDGTDTSGSGQEWTRVDVNWVKSTSETLTVDCVYQIISG